MSRSGRLGRIIRRPAATSDFLSHVRFGNGGVRPGIDPTSSRAASSFSEEKFGFLSPPTLRSVHFGNLNARIYNARRPCRANPPIYNPF